MKAKTQRSFVIGDNWLYYKIYTGAKTADAILTDIIKPVTTFLIKEGIIDKWFFIRYADPKHHLRVRFHYTNPEHIGKIINNFQPYFTQYANQDLIWKIQTDTYNRELERYGANTIELAEKLFYYDSKTIVNFLNLIEGDEGEELRWLFGLRMIDALLDNFQFTPEEKCGLLERLKTGFGNEFGMNRFLKKQLDDKYRQKRKTIEGFFSVEEQEVPDYLPILKIIFDYKQTISPIAKNLVQLHSENQLEIALENLLSSYIHMTMNRLFKSKNRVHEMVCYDFLYRFYKSLHAKNK